MLTIDKRFTCVFWDFDGVLLNSNHIRSSAFRHSLQDFPSAKVDKLIKYHELNGGLSRYVKFNYFFIDILEITPSKEILEECLSKFNSYCMNKLNDMNLLIDETLGKVNVLAALNIDQHITSGSDETELNRLCDNLGISKFFITIKGSPIAKRKNIETIIQEHSYDKRKCVMIGDSINDRDAAEWNGISFIPYGNKDILPL